MTMAIALSPRYIHKFRQRIFPGNSPDCIGRINNRIKRRKKEHAIARIRSIQSQSVNVRGLRNKLRESEYKIQRLAITSLCFSIEHEGNYRAKLPYALHFFVFLNFSRRAWIYSIQRCMKYSCLNVSARKYFIQPEKITDDNSQKRINLFISIVSIKYIHMPQV